MPRWTSFRFMTDDRLIFECLKTDGVMDSLADELFAGQASQGGDLVHRAQLRQRVDRGFDQRYWIIGAIGLGQDIVDTGGFANCTNSLSGNHTGTGTSRQQQ